jgi:hypothetical protein
MIVSVNTLVAGGLWCSEAKKHRLAGFVSAFPIMLKHSPFGSHSSVELVEQGQLSSFGL